MGRTESATCVRKMCGCVGHRLPARRIMETASRTCTSKALTHGSHYDCPPKAKSPHEALLDAVEWIKKAKSWAWPLFCLVPHNLPSVTKNERATRLHKGWRRRSGTKRHIAQSLHQENQLSGYGKTQRHLEGNRLEERRSIIRGRNHQ